MICTVQIYFVWNKLAIESGSVWPSRHFLSTIVRWRYTSPYALDASASFPANYPGAVAIGKRNQETYVIWLDSGFYIAWDGIYCAREPILLINESEITLWKNEEAFVDCGVSEGKHMLEIELETTIHQDDWTFSVERAAP